MSLKPIPEDIREAFVAALLELGIPHARHGPNLRWLTFYFDFCGKYQHSLLEHASLGAFLAKLASRKVGPDDAVQASQCVQLLWSLKLPGALVAPQGNHPAGHIPAGAASSKAAGSASASRVTARTSDLPKPPSATSGLSALRPGNAHHAPGPTKAPLTFAASPHPAAAESGPKRLSAGQPPAADPKQGEVLHLAEASAPLVPSAAQRLAAPVPEVLGAHTRPSVSPAAVADQDAREPIRTLTTPGSSTSKADSFIKQPDVRTKPGAPQASDSAKDGHPLDSWPASAVVLERVIRLRHLSPRTHEAYRMWLRTLRTFVRNKPPRDITMEDVGAFLGHLAVERRVSASTQNQAFNALLFLHRHVWEVPFVVSAGVARARRNNYVPQVLSQPEVASLLAHMSDRTRLAASMLYGCGLRLTEALRLRVQDIHFDRRTVFVFQGKGGKDRSVPLPEGLVQPLKQQLLRVRALHLEDLAAGARVLLDHLPATQQARAGRELAWQWLFPAVQLTTLPTSSGERFRHHLHETHVQHDLRQALVNAGITRRASAHTLRHSYASHLLQSGHDIRTIQQLLGHADVSTTMIYTHTLPAQGNRSFQSPWDTLPEAEASELPATPARPGP